MNDRIDGERPDVREYLAAERTLLAYIRTGLALMGFGFVVARFSLFLHEIRMMRPEAAAEAPGLSIWFGTALVVLGVALNVISVFEYRGLVARLNEGQGARWHAAKLPVATALILSACGLAMTGYLFTLR